MEWKRETVTKSSKVEGRPQIDHSAKNITDPVTPGIDPQSSDETGMDR